MHDELEDSALPEMEPNTKEKTVVNLTIEAADHHHYSNVASITLSPWDIRLNFADVDISHEDGKFKAHHGIVMPPEHAAALMFLLTSQLTVFEKQFGPIRQKRWRAMVAKAAQEAAADPTRRDE